MSAATPERIGRYRVLGKLGEGAMGVVYRAHDDGLERDVALKLVRADSADGTSRERFLREARAAARLQHPNIITVFELGDHEGAPFMAMELLDGIDLQRGIEGGLRPDPRITLPIVLQLLAGLGHAHEHGIVHRDVKPSNLFLPRGRPAKVMDFGVARLGGAATTTGLIVGTPNYMSPEQVQALPLDGRSDLFSAGLILYELVTGEKAYRGDSIVALLYKIAHEDPDLVLLPPGPQWERLRAVLARALARRPDQRYQEAAAMSADLALALQDLGGSAETALTSDHAILRRTASRAVSGNPAPTVHPDEGAAVPPDPVAVPTTAAAVDTPRGAAVRARRGVLAAATAVVALLALAAVTLIALLLAPERGPVAPEKASPTPSSLAVPSPIAVPKAAAATPPPSPAADSPAPRVPSPRAAVAETPETPERPPEPAVPPPARGTLERANELYERGRYAAALAEAKAVLRGDPGNAEAKGLAEDIEADLVVETRLKDARDAIRRGDRDAALAHVRAGLAVKSSDGRLLALFRELTQ